MIYNDNQLLIISQLKNMLGTLDTVRELSESTKTTAVVHLTMVVNTRRYIRDMCSINQIDADDVIPKNQ